VKRRTISEWMRRDSTFPRPLVPSRRPYPWDRREMWDWGAGKPGGSSSLGTTDASTLDLTEIRTPSEPACPELDGAL
jgi:hypothetical protein